MLDYIHSDKKFVPQEISLDIKRQIGFELKYWKIPVHNEYKKLLVENRNKLQILFNSEPKMYPEAPKIALENWKT